MEERDYLNIAGKNSWVSENTQLVNQQKLAMKSCAVG